jgi:RNA polymerase sigma factor (TIGR02999 family)
MAEITSYLQLWAEGDKSALDNLFLLVQAELRRQAAFRMRHERKNHTMGVTALVNELYCKLRRGRNIRLHDRQHFHAIAMIAMRQILHDHWREFERRPQTVPLETEHSSLPALLKSEFHTEDQLAVKTALERLAKEAPRKAQVVKLRIFVGLQNGEIARRLKISENQVIRYWNDAKDRLSRELAIGKNDEFARK